MDDKLTSCAQLATVPFGRCCTAMPATDRLRAIAAAMCPTDTHHDLSRNAVSGADGVPTVSSSTPAVAPAEPGWLAG